MSDTKSTNATFTVRVDCYAGHRSEETPRRFAIGREWIGVRRILDQWQGPDYRYFKLLGDDEALYILRYNERMDRWELTLFESAFEGEVAPVTDPKQ